MNQKSRANPLYRNWREAVLRRDNGLCQQCGKIGTHAHHIKNWREFLKERFIIGNGLTLCAECHGYIEGFGAQGKPWKPLKKKGRKPQRQFSYSISGALIMHNSWRNFDSPYFVQDFPLCG